MYSTTQKRSIRDPSEDDIIVNKRSRVDPANNNDIPFEYAETGADPSHQFTTIQDIIHLEENELTCVKGILTLRPDSIQQIPMKDGYLVSMLESCSVTDDTGTCRLTLWGTAIQEVANHKCYSKTDLRVKIFNSIKYLTSTPATIFTIAEDFSTPYQITFQKFYWLIVTRLGWPASNVENKSPKLQQPPQVLSNVAFAALCNLSPHVT